MFKMLPLCANTSSQVLCAVSDISVNNVVLLSAPDLSQSLFEFLHVIEHKICGHSVFGLMAKSFVAKPNSSPIFLSRAETLIYSTKMDQICTTLFPEVVQKHQLGEVGN